MTHPPELRERAHALREQGLLIRQIAEQIEIPTATVIRWLNPELEHRERMRARKMKFSAKKKCPTCNRKMANNAHLCMVCWNKKQKVWTREKIVEAIQQWALDKGEAPTYQEWTLSGPGHPAIWTVLSGNNPAFNSWSEALTAAGFTPRLRRSKNRLSRETRAEMRRNAREQAIKRAVAKENT